MSNDKSNRRPLFKIALFLVCAIAIFLVLNTLYSFAKTLNQLDVIESERDQWQRPVEVLRALDVREGYTVVDLGSGAGYFSLKISPANSTMKRRRFGEDPRPARDWMQAARGGCSGGFQHQNCR